MKQRAPEQIEKRRLYQEVMERLISLIKEGGLRPGDRLPSERALMERYGVGRPAVREALQNMANIGLVTLTQGERASVAAPSFSNLIQTVSLTTKGILRHSSESLDDLKEARLLFESQMVRLAVERATDEQIMVLEQRLKEHSGSLDNLGTFLHHDMLFHREIAAMTGNSIFPHLSEALIGWLAEFHLELVRLPGAEQLTLSEHASIFDAVKARDADAAEEAMRNHLTRANKLYQHLLPESLPSDTA
ncbi:MAG: transcriptional regulator NanR [Bauldia sp.]|uniref:transcriptional regulator NanR n=1 Tax=Bauldia sp. TaxID=2575872 RepID=UPI001E0BF590|nr:transcriptional regulator NanR [Bauldia sp.]MCB1495570.1 transcriptional regulator NanR [Bauldia sp.]